MRRADWMRILISIGMLWAVSARAASDKCSSMDLQVLSATADLSANPFPALTLRVSRNNEKKGCGYFVTVDYGTAASFSARHLDGPSGAELPVQIYADVSRTRILKNLADAASTQDVLSGVFPEDSGGNTADLVYRPFLQPQFYLRFGLYSQTYQVRLYQGTLADFKLEKTRSFTLVYTQQKRVDLSLVDTGGAFDLADTSQTLDFGTLTAGAIRACDLVLQYNAGYQLSLTSQNGGKLKGPGPTATIDYTLSVAGVARDLSSGPLALAPVTGVSPPGGSRLPVQVTIGSLAGKGSGVYQDTITLTVTSVE